MVTLMVIKKGTFSKCLEVLFRSSEWVFSTFTNFSAVHTSVSACENSRGTHVHVNIGLTYNTMSSARHSIWPICQLSRHRKHARTTLQQVTHIAQQSTHTGWREMLVFLYVAGMGFDRDDCPGRSERWSCPARHSSQPRGPCTWGWPSLRAALPCWRRPRHEQTIRESDSTRGPTKNELLQNVYQRIVSLFKHPHTCSVHLRWRSLINSFVFDKLMSWNKFWAIISTG